jgi:hypothetical protein
VKLPGDIHYTTSIFDGLTYKRDTDPSTGNNDLLHEKDEYLSGVAGENKSVARKCTPFFWNTYETIECFHLLSTKVLLFLGRVC